MSRGLRAAALGLALAVPAGATAQTTPCGDRATQLEMNDCAAAAWKAADAQLNAAYKKARAFVAGGPAEAALRDAQRAWIAFRDLACQAEGKAYEGGSIVPLVVSSCLERVTRARTQDLLAFRP